MPQAAGAVAEPVTLEIEVSEGGKVECRVGAGSYGACQSEYLEGKKLTLKAVAEKEKGYEFAGWEFGTGSAEACSGKGVCEFIISEESSVEAVFELISPLLTIKYAGVGEGEVACRPWGGTEETCEEKYEYGTELILVPEAFPGSEFLGFKNGKGSAESCAGIASCSFTLKADSTIEAVFGPAMHALTITKAGTGQGTVTCNGSACAASYPEGTELALKATPATGSSFAGWSGEGCSGTGTCVVVIEEKDAAVTATFQASAQPPPPPPPTSEGTVKTAAIAKVKSGRAAVRLSCLGGPCQGTLKLTAKVLQGGKRKTLAIGKSSFDLAAGASKIVKVKLSAAALRELARALYLRARSGGPDVVVGAVKLKLAG